MAKKENKAPENSTTQDTGSKGPVKNRAFRAGGYSVVVSVVVIAIVVVVNMLVGQLPATVTQLDLTPGQIFELGEQTENITANLQDDITFYWLVQNGQEDNYVTQTLERYTALTDKIHIEKKDPLVHPNFATQYTSDTLYNNSLIVVNGERSKYVSYNDIVTSVYDSNTGGYTYQYEAESAITSAIDYVTSDDIPVVYILQGHGELSMPTEMRKAVQKQNITFANLNLMSSPAVPEDADALFIYGPERDLSTEETTLLRDYLAGGGNLLLITDYLNGETLPNLHSLMAYYGVEVQDGFVFEGNSNRNLRGVPYYLLPQISAHTITSPLMSQGFYVLMPIAQGLTVTGDTRSTLTVTEILKTTEQSYSKVAGFNLTTEEKEDGDIDGPFATGVVMTETIGTTTTTNIVWYTASELLNADINSLVAGGNQDLFVNSMAYLCQREQAISIHAKSLTAEQLTIPSSAISALSVVFIGVVPVVLIVIGIIVMVRRRRR